MARGDRGIPTPEHAQQVEELVILSGAFCREGSMQFRGGIA